MCHDCVGLSNTSLYPLPRLPSTLHAQHQNIYTPKIYLTNKSLQVVPTRHLNPQVLQQQVHKPHAVVATTHASRSPPLPLRLPQRRHDLVDRPAQLQLPRVVPTTKSTHTLSLHMDRRQDHHSLPKRTLHTARRMRRTRQSRLRQERRQRFVAASLVRDLNVRDSNGSHEVRSALEEGHALEAIRALREREARGVRAVGGEVIEALHGRPHALAVKEAQLVVAHHLQASRLVELDRMAAVVRARAEAQVIPAVPYELFNSCVARVSAQL